MDPLKSRRTKVSIGDCVSVASSYFGPEYQKAIDEALGFACTRIFGRVTRIRDGNRSFDVSWDVDGEITMAMSLDNVSYEPRDTPTQKVDESSSIITMEDFEGLDVSLEQGSSSKAAEDHALLHEDFVEPIYDTLYTLFRRDGNSQIDCMSAYLVPCTPGTLVHNKKILPNQRKFLIVTVLHDEGNEDFCSGAFIVWDKDYISIRSDDGSEKKRQKDHKATNKNKGKEKLKKNKKTSETDESEKETTTEDEEEEYEGDMVDLEEEQNEVVNMKNTTRKSKTKRKGRKRTIASERDDSDDDDDDDDIGVKKTMEKSKKKKAKLRKIRSVTKVVVGKKAADKVKKKNKDKQVEDENILDYEEEVEEVEELNKKKKIEKITEEKKLWKEGSRRINPRGEIHIPKAKLLDPNAELWHDKSYIEYFFTFLPSQYIREVMLPATNRFAKENGFVKEIKYEELIHSLGLLYMMEVVRLPERRMYWHTEPEGMFPACNFGRVISIHRFEQILNVLQLSENEDMDQQVLDFIDAVNRNLKASIRAGEVLCLDESMIKAFHKGLNGKMKIIRKPRPIGNELKTVSDANTHIVLHMELHESKEDMANKDHVKELGATAACCLRLTDYWKGSGRIVVGDSWFGSLKTCIELWKTNGLYSIMLVKTAHKNFPRELLREKNLARGGWTSALADVDGLKVTATRFIDLQEKLFISSCSTDLDGPPRVTKYHGNIRRPQVAYDYLSNSASIDVHNHFRTGSVGLEDAWQTKNAHMRQFAGVLGFLFTNSYLAYKTFQKSNIKHCDFKIKLANALMIFKEKVPRPARNSLEIAAGETAASVHVLRLLERPGADKDGMPKKRNRYQRECFYCQHNPQNSPQIHKTSYHCEGCVGPNGQLYPLCDPKTGRDCFRLHIVNGLPSKRRYSHK